jgi:ubiquinol-cytochrome c reductase cytochrome c1 subunit
MKEFKILAVVVFFTLVTYYLVEPFAHSQMHAHVESEGFSYDDLPALQKKGDAARGKELVMGAGACTGCHSIEAAGMPAAMDPVTNSASYGVNPPDLSNAGGIYSPKFLAALIKNPAHALKVEHKFTPESGRMHPMVAFYGAGGDIDQEVADMVAYLQSIAPKPDQITPKQAFETACGRCHAVKYENWTQIGEKPKFKKKRDELVFLTQLEDYKANLMNYMGKLPPDLSMYIRSRGEHYLSTFIENPQNLLHGTAMPRVGVSEVGAEKVIEYLEDAGDPKRAERDSVGVKVMIFLLVFAAAAYLWKKEIWKDLH